MPEAIKSVRQACSARADCAVSAVCAAPAGQLPCASMVSLHGAKLALCDLLETIADSLPAGVDRRACLSVSERLLPVVREAHRFEEGILYPAFGHAGVRGATLRRLESEHVEDEALAEEVTEVLLGISHGGSVENPEALGFMLRAFFETMRRHIAFEREHMIPAIHGLSAQ